LVLRTNKNSCMQSVTKVDSYGTSRLIVWYFVICSWVGYLYIQVSVILTF
jgi:hypothetical protein